MKLLLVTWEDKFDIDQNDADPLDLIAEKDKKAYENKKYLALMIENLSSDTDLDFRDLHQEISHFLRNRDKDVSNTKLPDYPYEKVHVFDMEYILSVGSKTPERNLKAILGKFKGTPKCGYRYLKPADERFIRHIQDLISTFPNCRELLDFISHFAKLSMCSNSKGFRIPPVLLSGNPGIGKTEVVKQIVKLLGVSYRQIDCAALTSPAVISGSAITYSDSKVGIVVESIRDSYYANNFLILDEIEKARRDSINGQDMLGSLYSLLEQTSAKEFTDEALCKPMDASHINWLATANWLERIDGPMLSRFYVIKIGDVEGEHHKTVTQSIYNSLIEKGGYDKTFSQELNTDVFSELESLSPRQVKVVLLRAMAQAAYNNTKKRKIKINKQDLIFDFTKTEKDNFTPMGFY